MGIHGKWRELKDHDVLSLEQLEHRAKELDTLKKVTMFCPQHHGKELELYCETHGQLVYHNSTINGRHEYCKLVVADSYNRLKAEISATLQPVEEQLSAINSALDEIDQRSKELNDKRIATEANILQKLKQLQKLLDTREAELITQLNQVTQEKLKNFASKKESIKVIQT